MSGRVLRTAQSRATLRATQAWSGPPEPPIAVRRRVACDAHTARRPTLATLPLTGRAAPLGQPVPRRGTQARRAGARRPQAASYTGPSANAAAHTRRPPIPYAIRVPIHRWSITLHVNCTSPTARARLPRRGHGTCDRAERGTSVSPPLGCYAGCYADRGLSIVAFSSSSRPHLQYVPEAVHRPCTLRLWASKRRAAARRYAMPAPSSHMDCLPSALERALLALPQS